MERSPEYIALLHPENLNLFDLIRNAPPHVLFAHSKVTPDRYVSEKRKWLKTIRLLKLYRFLTRIEDARNANATPIAADVFVHLDSRKLQKEIGAMFLRTGRVILENIGAVESRHEYQDGVRVLQYRLALPYRNQKQSVAAYVKAPQN
jgi:hypothetical protein